MTIGDIWELQVQPEPMENLDVPQPDQEQEQESPTSFSTTPATETLQEMHEDIPSESLPVGILLFKKPLIFIKVLSTCSKLALLHLG